MSKLEGTKKMIRAVLLSCKEGIPAHKMNGDYKALTGGGIPFVKLGFNSVEEFIRSIPDVVRVSQNRGEIMYHAVADASTAHIQKMVSKQKSKKKKVKAYKGYRPYQRSYGGMSSGTQRRMGYSPQIRGPRPRAGLLPTPKPAYRPSPQPLKRIVPKRPVLPTPKSVYTNPLGNCRTDAPHHHHAAASRPPSRPSTAHRPMPPAAVRRNTVANQNPTSLQNRTVTAKSAGGMSVTLKNASVHNRQVTGAYRVCDTIPKVTGACHIKPPVQRTVTVKKVPPVAKPIKRTISLNADDVYTSGKSVQPQRTNLTKGSKVTHSGAENYHPNLPPRLQKVRQEEKDWKEEFVECNRSPVTKQSVSNNVKNRIKEILARNPEGVHSIKLSTIFYERFKTELPQSVVHGLECGNIRDVAIVKKQTRGAREKIMLYPKKDPIPEWNAASVGGTTAKQSGQNQSLNWQKQIVEIQDKVEAPANIEKGTLEKVRKLLAKNISGVHSINLESMYFDLYRQRLPSRVVLGLECGLLKDVAVVEKLTLGNKEKIIFYPIRESQKRTVSGPKETVKPKTSRPLSGSVNDAKTVKDPSPQTSRRSSSSTENDGNVLVGDFTKERIRKILSTSPQGVAATSFGALFHETYKYKLSDVVLQRLADGELDDVAMVQKVRIGNVEKIIIFPLKKAVECKAPKYSAISMKIVKIPERRELSLGSEHEVNISHIDGCGQFYVQLFSCHDEFKTVLEFAKCIKFGTMETVATGMDVMTSFEPGRRARIISIADDNAEVFHIDFGDTRRVRKTELAVVPAEIAAIPAMATQCRLHKPASSGALWSDYASLKFQQMCLDESAKIKVNSVERLTSPDGRESCVHTVTCYINNFNVNGRLQHEELAHEAAKAHTPDQTTEKNLESSQKSSIMLPPAEADTQPHQDITELEEESENESSYETIESASSCGDISGDEEWVTDVTESRHSTSDHRTHGGYIASASDVRTGKNQMSMGDSYKSIQKAERPTLAKIEAEKSSNSDVLHTTNTTKETNYPKDVHPSTQAGVAYVKHELHTKLDAPTSAQLGSQKVKTEPRTQLPPNKSAFRNVQGNASLPAAPPGLKPCVGGFGLPFPPPGFESPFVQPGTLNIKTEPCTPPVLTSGSGDQSFQTQPCQPTRRLAPPPGFEPMPPAHPANLNIKTDPCMKPVLPAEFGDGNTSRFKNPLLPSPVPESKPNQPNRVVETPSEEWMPLGTSSAVPSPVAFTEGRGRRTSWAGDAGVDADFATLKHGVRSESVDYDTTSKNLGPRRPPVGAAGGGGSYISSRNTSLSSGIGSPVVLPSPQKGMTERTPRPNSVPALFNVSDTPYACERGSPLGSTGAPMSTQRSFGSMKIEAYLDKNDNLTPVHDPKWGKAGLPGSIRSYPRDTVYLTAPLQLPCKVRTFGKLIDVIVTHVVSPGMFFMVPTEKMAILGAFTRSLTEYYTNNFTPVSDVKKDTTYVAICEVNGATACHRVKVCQPIGGFASVFLIDQGRFDCVPIKNICDISPRFTTFTPFAISGRLAGIKPKIVTDESIAAITRRFEERVLRKELVAHVLRMSKVKDQFVYDVALCDVSGEVEDEWINDTMVEDWGVADYVSKLDSSHAMPE